jgi:hypothetical protein
MNRRAFLLGLLGAAPTAAVASSVAADVKPSGINDAIREAGRYWGPEWHDWTVLSGAGGIREWKDA